MKRLFLAAAVIAVLALAACTHAAAPRAASHNPHSGARGAASATHGAGTPKGSGSHGSHTVIRPVSCREQYRHWMHGEGKALMGSLDAVAAASKVGIPGRLAKALKGAKPAVAKAVRHPIPACADPRGYWTVLLMHVNAAVTGKSSASSVRAAMQDVRKIHDELVAEVKQST